MNKANRLIRNGKASKAVNLLTAFQKKKKGENHYYIDFLLGNCLMMMDKAGKKNLSRAARAYEQALAKAPDLFHTWLNLAQCRYSSGEMKAAAKAFIKGYDTAEEKQAVTLYYGAACRFFAGLHQSALTTFKRLLTYHGSEVKLEWTFVCKLRISKFRYCFFK